MTSCPPRTPLVASMQLIRIGLVTTDNFMDFSYNLTNANSPGHLQPIKLIKRVGPVSGII